MLFIFYRTWQLCQGTYWNTSFDSFVYSHFVILKSDVFFHVICVLRFRVDHGFITFMCIGHRPYRFLILLSFGHPRSFFPNIFTFMYCKIIPSILFFLKQRENSPNITQTFSNLIQKKSNRFQFKFYGLTRFFTPDFIIIIFSVLNFLIRFEWFLKCSCKQGRVLLVGCKLGL